MLALTTKSPMANTVTRLRSILLVMLFGSSPVALADDWYWQADAQLLLQVYPGAQRLDNLTGFGLRLGGDYLERAGFTLGYNVHHKNFIAVASDDPRELDENIFYLSGHGNFHPAALPGRIGVRLDAYDGQDEYHSRVSGGGGMGGSSRQQTVSDSFSVLSPLISYLNFAKTFYLDLGYAYSRYHADDGVTDDLSVQQWTPTLGLGFNRAYDWLQLRGYFITPSNSNRLATAESTQALELKWSHWFGADAPLGLHNLTLTLLTGERRYAVDGDTYSLGNVPDLQKGAVALALSWKLSEATSLVLAGSYSRYQDTNYADDYNSALLFASLSQRW